MARAEPDGDDDGPWGVATGELARHLGVEPVRGLSATEAAARLERDGPNTLDRSEGRTGLSILLAQFTNAMTGVLAVAAAVTVLIGEAQDAAVIGAIVLLNALVGFAQEYRAERAMAALAQLAGEAALVRRDGVPLRIRAEDLVVGDVAILAAGDVVPADLRLLEVHGLRTAEAALTGESEPVVKTSEDLGRDRGLLLGDRLNMAHRGTAVTDGRGEGLVVATAGDTEIGQIAALLHSRQEVPTPLERRLARLARRMAGAAVAVCAVVFAVGTARGEPVDVMFLTAVSLAVAAIPEGLPAVITAALALGARRMSRHHAIVRKLTAVETLGSVNVICTDKTGTLTENRMAVERVWTPAGDYRFEGRGYEPAGSLLGGDPSHDGYLSGLLAAVSVCNDASLQAPAAAGGQWEVNGDPTEGALLVAAERGGVNHVSTRRGWPRIGEMPFDAQRRRMVTLHRHGAEVVVVAKGAMEAIVPLLSRAQARVIAEAGDVAARWACEGLRVLAVAVRRSEDVPEDPEAELELLGLTAITDPPRRSSAGAIAECSAAGVDAVVVTGDHPATAAAIARRIGIPVDSSSVMTGRELGELGEEALARRIESVRVFARVDPAQKLRIVDAWHQRGRVVAMTGDGVNDAPALRQADIGVAMGRTGTEVSKQAADMILVDDNFATIVQAIGEGRRIYDNIRRTVRYLLTTNSGEVFAVFLAPVLALPLPLLPMQILWVNLVTDGLPAIALGVQPAEPDAMRRPPRAASESLFAHGLWQHAVGFGLLMAALVLPMEAAARAAGWHWRTMTFTTLAFLQLGHALAVRSEHQSSWRLRSAANGWLYLAVAGTVAVQLALVYLPELQGFFHTAALRPVELAVVVATSSLVYLAVEAEKSIRRRLARRSSAPGVLDEREGRPMAPHGQEAAWSQGP